MSGPMPQCWGRAAVDFTECSDSGNSSRSHSFSGIFSVVSPCLHLFFVYTHPRCFQLISLFWMRLLQSMNAMISGFPVLALGLTLRSPASDLVPCFLDAKQLFGFCNQGFLTLAKWITSMSSLLSVSMLYFVSQPVSSTCPLEQVFSRGGIAQAGTGVGHPFVLLGNPEFWGLIIKCFIKPDAAVEPGKVMCCVLEHFHMLEHGPLC